MKGNLAKEQKKSKGTRNSTWKGKVKKGTRKEKVLFLTAVIVTHKELVD